MSDNLTLYKYFMAAAETFSITDAAKKLFVSQPAVSAGISKLEDFLGTSLFFRTNKGIALTEEGKLLYEYVSKAFSFIEEGEDRLREISGLREGVLRIGASDMTMKFLLFDLIKTFKTRHPGIRLLISNSPTPRTIAQLKNGEIDIAAISSPFDAAPELEVLPCKKIRDIFICSPSYTEKDRMTLEELSKEKVIMLDRETTSRIYMDGVLSADGRCKIVPDIELATSDLLIDSAIRGFGISVIVENFVTDHLKKGILKEIKVDISIPERELMIVFQKKSQLSAAAREFLKIAVESGVLLSL